MTPDDTLDATGLPCPLPVLKARKRLKGMAAGSRLCVLADDPAAVIDIPHYCAEAGHTLEVSETAASPMRFVIRKGGPAG